MSEPEIVYYTWSRTRRSEDLSAALDSVCLRPSFPEGYDGRGVIWKRLPVLIGRFLGDVRKLRNTKARIVITEYGGGLIKLFITCVACKLKGIPYGIDCHTGGYIKAHPRGKLYTRLEKYFIRRAACLIAHNESTLDLDWLHPNMSVIESKVPGIDRSARYSGLRTGKTNVVFIVSFSPDEPIEEILEATRSFDESYHFHLTGNWSNMFERPPQDEYPNVSFTGFLRRRDYDGLLANCDIIVALTRRDYTLLYGGREAISAEKPLVASNNQVCADYFTRGAVLVGYSPPQIEAGIREAVQRQAELSQQMREIKSAKLELFDRRVAEFKARLSRLILNSRC